MVDQEGNLHYRSYVQDVLSQANKYFSFYLLSVYKLLRVPDRMVYVLSSE